MSIFPLERSTALARPLTLGQSVYVEVAQLKQILLIVKPRSQRLFRQSGRADDTPVFCLTSWMEATL